MKNVFTLAIALASLCAHAQFPILPYNPDENGDGLIGVVDLQGLLANYGNEFESVVLSEDGESAIVYMGQMGYYTCEHNCEQLPGFWQVSGASDLVPVQSELNVSGYTLSWVNRTGFESNLSLNSCPYYQGSNNSGQRVIEAAGSQQNYRCYCAANQLPRVEYEICNSYSPNNMNQTLQELRDNCVNPKLAEGWMLKGDVNCNSEGRCFQTLWRWVE